MRGCSPLGAGGVRLAFLVLLAARQNERKARGCRNINNSRLPNPANQKINHFNPRSSKRGNTNPKGPLTEILNSEIPKSAIRHTSVIDPSLLLNSYLYPNPMLPVGKSVPPPYHGQVSSSKTYTNSKIKCNKKT